MKRLKNLYHRLIALGATTAIGAFIVGLVLKFYTSGEWWAAAMGLVASGIVWMYATAMLSDDR